MRKVGFLGTRGIGNYGGFETIAKKVSENIDTKHFEFSVSQEVDNAREEYEIEKVKKQVSLLKQRKSFFKKISSGLDNMFNEGKIINDIFIKNKLQMDVVFQCGSTPGLTMGDISNKNSLLIWNPDGIEWKREKFNKVVQKILYYSTIRGIKKSYAVTLDSVALLDKMRGMICENKPVYYLPSGTDIIEEKDVCESVLKEYSLKKKEYYILVARAVPENHILEIVNYFLKVNSSKKLLIISNFGKDSYSRKVLETIKQNPQKIIFKGPEYNSEKLNALRFFSIAYLHGHSVGGTNPSLLEALGAGNPCICYDVSFNKEVAREAGVYFRDFSSFNKILIELEKDRVKLEKMSKRAIERVKESYEWDYITELHESVVMHSLMETKRISEDKFNSWLERKKYKKRLVENRFGIIK